MRHQFVIYLCAILLVLASCVKEAKDSSIPQIAGMWAQVNDDKTVAKLIEFKDGAYIEYTHKGDDKLYCHDAKVWHATIDDFIGKRYQYTLAGSNLILSNSETLASVSVKDDKLYLEGIEYQYIKELDVNYGSIINIAECGDEIMEYPLSSQEVIWEYEVTNIPKNLDLIVSPNVGWINNLSIKENQISFNIEENTTLYKRSAVVEIYHPAAGVKEVNILQLAIITAPVVQSLEPENVSYTKATVKGEILHDGNGIIKSRGFYLGLDPENLQKYEVELSDESMFFLEMNDLQDGATYYYKAYAENEIGESYSEMDSLTTQQYYPPIVQTLLATNISYTTAVLNAEITNNGGAKVTDCGFYYGLTQSDMTKISCGTMSEKFTAPLTALQDGATYYFQAYATNQKGESLGDIKSLTTLPIFAPSVTTNSASDISYTTAMLNAEITNDGGAKVTDCGFYYGLTQSDMTKISCGTMSEKFTAPLTALQDGATYCFQAYAINQKGESLGELLTFTTNEITFPDVSTVSATDISYTTAKLTGRINSNGGTSIIEYGFYYKSGTESKKKVIVGSSASGNFSVELTGLNHSTKYSYQAYAINSKGTKYGTTLSFTTPVDKYNGHEYVDLGLPSGTIWATMNIGADSKKDLGNYYQWGQIFVYGTSDSNYVTHTLTEISGTQYDVARKEWGGLWRIPTKAEWVELREKCQWRSSGNGWEVVGPNNKSIYIGLTGGKNGLSYYPTYNSGCYWTSTKYSADEAYAAITSDYTKASIGNLSILWGFAIRPVISPN